MDKSKKQRSNLLTNALFYDTILTVDSTDHHIFYNFWLSYIVFIHYSFHKFLDKIPFPLFLIDGYNYFNSANAGIQRSDILAPL